jgi:hypothetical protein
VSDQFTGIVPIIAENEDGWFGNKPPSGFNVKIKFQLAKLFGTLEG